MQLPGSLCNAVRVGVPPAGKHRVRQGLGGSDRVISGEQHVHRVRGLAAGTLAGSHGLRVVSQQAQVNHKQ